MKARKRTMINVQKCAVDWEHRSNGGPDPKRIVRVPKEKDLFFCYWGDGQIEHRDAYKVYPDGRAILFETMKRYHDTRNWIQET